MSECKKCGGHVGGNGVCEAVCSCPAQEQPTEQKECHICHGDLETTKFCSRCRPTDTVEPIGKEILGGLLIIIMFIALILFAFASFMAMADYPPGI